MRPALPEKRSARPLLMHLPYHGRFFMRPSDIVWLLLLSALWGAAFIFLRVAAPVVDPGWIAFLRTGLAALTVIVYTTFCRLPLQLRAHWRAYLYVGALNASLPWLLYSYVGKVLPASYMVILNSSTPMFVLLIAMITGSEQVGRWKVLGLVLGCVGVSLIAGLGPLQMNADVGIAVGMCLVSALCYALGGLAIRHYGKDIDSRVLTAGSMLIATLLLVPALGPAPDAVALEAKVIGAIAVLGMGCSGIGYLIYYRMVGRVGASRSLTVTYLMPLFGTFYGVVLLDEPFGLGIAVGGMTVLLATALVTGVLRPRAAVR
jgi:drug/metabolite transporter (DMT)-like permease